MRRDLYISSTCQFLRGQLQIGLGHNICEGTQSKNVPDEEKTITFLVSLTMSTLSNDAYME